MTFKRIPKHPFVEEAELLEDLLKEQRFHDKRNDGMVIFESEDAEKRARERAKRLRYLARLDIDEGNWPQSDEDGAL